MKNCRLHGLLKQITLIIILVIGNCLLIIPCFAEEAVSSAELINNARQYDGKAVLYKGEIIGDIMMRKDFAWINVNDGVNAIGVWADKNLVDEIIYAGNYKSRGDVVEIKGIFHRACLEHGGDLDIHAETLRKVEAGAIIKQKPDITKRKTAFILLTGLFIAIALSQLKQKNK